MTPRIDITKYIGSGVGKAMLALSAEAAKHIDHTLFELVKIRASQINGCAYCLDMHTKDARQAGETEQRLYGLSAWREAPYYSDRERAALEWTEAITLLSESHVPDDVYQHAKAQFNDDELVALTFGIVVINSWNRLAVSFRAPTGTYRPQAMASR
jgi:AhpD family alkylhydroperoxidase